MGEDKFVPARVLHSTSSNHPKNLPPLTHREPLEDRSAPPTESTFGGVERGACIH